MWWCCGGLRCGSQAHEPPAATCSHSHLKPLKRWHGPVHAARMRLFCGISFVMLADNMQRATCVNMNQKKPTQTEAHFKLRYNRNNPAATTAVHALPQYPVCSLPLTCILFHTNQGRVGCHGPLRCWLVVSCFQKELADHTEPHTPVMHRANTIR